MLFYLEILGLVVLTILAILLIGVFVWAFKQTVMESVKKSKDEFNYNQTQNLVEAGSVIVCSNCREAVPYGSYHAQDLRWVCERKSNDSNQSCNNIGR